MAACTVSSTFEVDTQAHADAIREELVAEGVDVESATCPRGVEYARGATFLCTIKVQGEEHAIEGTIESKLEISMRWLAGTPVYARKIEKVLAVELATLSPTASFDCGKPLRFLDADRELVCQATVGGITADVMVELDERGVPLRYELGLIERSVLVERLLPAVRAQFGAELEIDCGTAPVFRSLDEVRCEALTSTGRKRMVLLHAPGSKHVDDVRLEDL